ncbi:hypothetical protein [Rhizobium sp. Root1220]|nr:hypothetical protein [Rhizobium sp. Root1220]
MNSKTAVILCVASSFAGAISATQDIDELSLVLLVIGDTTCRGQLPTGS